MLIYATYMDKLSKLEAILKNSGHSSTNQRKLVFSVLDGGEALAMKDIVDTLKGKVDRASVYRNIDLFIKLDIVNQVHIGWKYKFELSDYFSDHHHHIACTKCQKIDTLKNHEALEENISQAAKNLDYRLTGHSMELVGICKSCQG